MSRLDCRSRAAAHGGSSVACNPGRRRSSKLRLVADIGAARHLRSRQRHRVRTRHSLVVEPGLRAGLFHRGCADQYRLCRLRERVLERFARGARKRARRAGNGHRVVFQRRAAVAADDLPSRGLYRYGGDRHDCGDHHADYWADYWSDADNPAACGIDRSGFRIAGRISRDTGSGWPGRFPGRSGFDSRGRNRSGL
jgi:hypothetical protein